MKTATWDNVSYAEESDFKILVLGNLTDDETIELSKLYISKQKYKRPTF